MTSTAKQPSYTQRLIESLKAKDVPDATLDAIRAFAKSESAVLEAKNAEVSTCYRWGKYRGKTFENIYLIDKSYMEWSLSNKQYLRQSEIETIEGLLK
jgi:hypothetical protein